MEKTVKLAKKQRWKSETMTEINPSIIENHAQHAERKGKTIIISSQWKGKEETLKQCQELENAKICGKPITHLVTCNTPRFYGFKHCENVFCERHAKAWFDYLQNSSDSAKDAQIRRI